MYHPLKTQGSYLKATRAFETFEEAAVVGEGFAPYTLREWPYVFRALTMWDHVQTFQLAVDGMVAMFPSLKSLDPTRSLAGCYGIVLPEAPENTRYGVSRPPQRRYHEFFTPQTINWFPIRRIAAK